MALFGGAEQALTIVIRARNEAESQLRAVEHRLEKVKKENESFLKGAAALGAAGTAALGGLGFMAVKAAGDMEQTRIAFTTMLGSAQKADAFIRDLVQFAKTTPFELRGLEQASKQLLAYGFAQDEVLVNLRALGDIASGVGMDKLPNLILAFGQVRAATKLTGMELRQFTEAGVPLLDELAKHMNKPVAEIQKLVSESKVGFADVQQALMNLTSEGGRFNNLMEKQAQSLGGMVSNLADTWDIFLREQGAKFLGFSKSLVSGMTAILGKLSEWTKANPALTSTIFALTGATTVSLAAFGSLLLILPKVTAAVRTLVVAMTASNAILLAASVAVGFIMTKLATFADEVGGFKNALALMGFELQLMFYKAQRAMLEALNSVARYIPGFADNVSGALDRVNAKIAETNDLAMQVAIEGVAVAQARGEDWGASMDDVMAKITDGMAGVGVAATETADKMTEAMKKKVEALQEIRTEVQQVYDDIKRANDQHIQAMENEEKGFRERVVETVAEAEQKIEELEDEIRQAKKAKKDKEIDDLRDQLREQKDLVATFEKSGLDLRAEVAEERKRLDMNELERLIYDHNKKKELMTAEFVEEQKLRLVKLSELKKEHDTIMGNLSAQEQRQAQVEMKKLESYRATLNQQKSALETWMNETGVLYQRYVSRVNSVLSAISASGGSRPKFEHGGIVPGPIGTAVPIVAHGGERILPASSSKGGSGGATFNVVINNPVVRDSSDTSRLKREIDNALRGLVRDHKLASV